MSLTDLVPAGRLYSAELLALVLDPARIEALIQSKDLGRGWREEWIETPLGPARVHLRLKPGSDTMGVYLGGISVGHERTHDNREFLRAMATDGSIALVEGLGQGKTAMVRIARRILEMPAETRAQAIELLRQTVAILNSPEARDASRTQALVDAGAALTDRLGSLLRMDFTMDGVGKLYEKMAASMTLVLHAIAERAGPVRHRRMVALSWGGWFMSVFLPELQRLRPELAPHELILHDSGVEVSGFGLDHALASGFHIQRAAQRASHGATEMANSWLSLWGLPSLSNSMMPADRGMQQTIDQLEAGTWRFLIGAWFHYALDLVSTVGAFEQVMALIEKNAAAGLAEMRNVDVTVAISERGGVIPWRSAKSLIERVLANPRIRARVIIGPWPHDITAIPDYRLHRALLTAPASGSEEPFAWGGAYRWDHPTQALSSAELDGTYATIREIWQQNNSWWWTPSTGSSPGRPVPTEQIRRSPPVNAAGH